MDKELESHAYLNHKCKNCGKDIQPTKLYLRTWGLACSYCHNRNKKGELEFK